MQLKKLIVKNLINIPGWRTSRKIIVIESDDWGSIRMPTKKTYDKLLSKGIPVDKSYFNRFDSLESNDDLISLFEILTSIKDWKGNHPVITANSLVANPDFDEIEKCNRTEFHYELISETYNHYPNQNQVLSLWINEGIKYNIFYPQYHGREHINAKKWLRLLNQDNLYEQLAFDAKAILGISGSEKNRKDAYMAAFEYENEEDKKYIENMAADGLKIFNCIFGFQSVSFAPSQSIQGDHINPVLAANGVKYHQLGQQFMPQPDGTLKVKNRYWGAKNQDGQIYWRRNATFEPSRNQGFDWVDSCLKEINIAFRWNKPAVINSHRVNYIGSISEDNRMKSHDQLIRLLTSIKKKWPEVEFLSSQDLGFIISKDVSKI